MQMLVPAFKSAWALCAARAFGVSPDSVSPLAHTRFLLTIGSTHKNYSVGSVVALLVPASKRS